MAFKTDEELTQYIRDELSDDDANNVIIIDGYPEAAMYLINDIEHNTFRVVYSEAGILNCLCKNGMDWLSAHEYYEYNVVRGWEYLPEANRPLILSIVADLTKQPAPAPVPAKKPRKTARKGPRKAKKK